jgi:hypothetical protein
LAAQNPNREIMCCLSCGRDTHSINGYCHRCIGQGWQIDDRKDRHVIHFDGDPICKQIKENEDNYGEDALGPQKFYYVASRKEENRHFDKMARLLNG